MRTYSLLRDVHIWLTRLQQGVEDTSMAMRVSHLPPNEADIEHALFVIDDGLICATVG